jgi:carboxyl-terminal processing protease
MSFSKIVFGIAFSILANFGSLWAAEHELLKESDINKIMKQIFDQHIDKKEITGAIIKNSFKVYIDQFDPDRTYLLEGEVLPFLDMQKSEIDKLIAQYKLSQFPEYTQLNDVIQKAINRARNIRTSIESNPDALFKKSQSLSSDGQEEWSDPDLKVSFAKNEKELENRITKGIIRFLASESQRFGTQFVASRQAQIVRLFERQTQAHENQYLFVNESGQKMSDAEKQNAFAMHVLKALASSLDAHTTVLSPTEAYDMRIRLEKETLGVGIALQPSPKGLVVTQIVVASPAAKSGMVKVDDILVEVNGVKIQGMSLDKVMEMLHGKKGTSVSLLLKRKEGTEEKMIPVTLTREEIAVDEDRASWSYEKIDGGIIGVIKLDSFYQGDNGVTSENDVREAIKQLDKHGKLRGLILDLRENSGGFLSQAVKVAGLFITNGVIVISKYFNGEEHFYRDMDGKISYDGPLIVLTSKATASAAEIVAQALQDYGVAIIVGDEHTYGKGTIQSQTVTDNQAATFFKVTVGKYYTVSGKTPQVQGVKADVVVPSPFMHENLGEEHLEYPVSQDVIPAAFDDKLEDINPSLKPWYMRYYAPTIQHRKLFWENMIPQLKAKSAARMIKNVDYQNFIKGKPTKANPNRLQMKEALEVMKDMITLQILMRGSESDLKGSKASPAGEMKHP